MSKLKQIESFVKLAVVMPEASFCRNVITGALVKNLWETLEHPPLTRLGDQYKYRAADGSNNVNAPIFLRRKRYTDLV